MNEEMSFLGLGFSSTSSQQNEATDSNASSAAAAAADSLMKHYLQQCVEYHETQQQLEQQQHQEEDVLQRQQAPQFVSATVEQQQQQPPITQHPTVEPVFTAPTPSVSTAAQDAMAKARAIVEKFQIQQHQQQQHVLEFQGGGLDTFIAPEEYRRRREAHFAKHQERLRKATLKNLEYVSKREELRLQQQLQQIHQSKQMEESLQRRHEIILQQRQSEKRAAFSSTAGIGTSKRQSLENKKRKKGHAIQSKSDDDVALYVTGLPMDESSFAERDVRNLFSSYGIIRKVHMYRNKTTGQVKGDALVVFQINTSSSSPEQRQEFMDTVCLQMTGAQLPNGSVLQVEPADPNHKKKQRTSNQQQQQADAPPAASYYGPSTTNDGAATNGDAAVNEEESTAMSNVATDEKDEEQRRVQEATEDLDDFFASL